VRPIRPEKTAKPGPMAPEARSAAEDPPTSLKPFRIGSRAGEAAGQTAMPARFAGASPIDRRTLARLRRGKTRPEARLDLHGLTQAQALPALTGFMMRAAAEDKRVVLVITGKGRGGDGHGPIPERPGVLRHNLPHWLASGQLAGLVLDILPAHRSHGGEGAFYVYLRRRR